MKLVITTPAGNCDVKVAETVYGQIQSIASYKAQYMNEDLAVEQSIRLLDMAIDGIQANPLQYPICPELEQNGIIARRILVDNCRYKVVFEFNANDNTATILLFMSSSQNITSALFQEAIRQLNRA